MKIALSIFFILLVINIIKFINGRGVYYNIEKSTSTFVGKEIITESPMLYHYNLPRDKCRNRICVFNADVELSETRLMNTPDKNNVTTKIRLRLLPAGSRLKVIEAFNLVPKLFLGDTKLRHLKLIDEKGITSEISVYAFKELLENKSKNMNLEKEYFEVKNIIDTKGELVFWGCASREIRDIKNNFNFDIYQNAPDKMKLNAIRSYSSYLEVNASGFVKTFQLEKELNILKRAKYEGFTSKQKGADNYEFYPDRRYSCVKYQFKTIDAYLLTKYYFSRWSGSSETFIFDDFKQRLCKKDKSEECYKASAVEDVNFSKIMNLNFEEIVDYK